jgi:hypothetical protein
MKLTQLLKENEQRPLSNEVKKHFLEIVSTYNKYQESMDRKSDIVKVAETLGGITEAARTLAIREGDDWFDKHTVKRNMSELDKLGKQFDKVALEAKALDQRMGGLYEDMGHILSRYYKIGEITEDEMKNRLGINEAKKFTVKKLGDDYYPYGLYYDKLGLVSGLRSNSKKEVENAIKSIQKINPRISEITKESKEDCGCGCGGKTPGGCGDSVNEETIVEQPVMVSKRTESGNIVTTLKEVSDLNEEEVKLYEFGQKVETLMEKNCPTDAGKWSASKAAAKKKFDVYPSAYANGWAAKNYKGKGGTWKKC